MRQVGVWLVGALAAVLLAAPVGAQRTAATPEDRTIVLDKVVASVNDEAVTLSEVQEEGQPVIRKIHQQFIGEERDRQVELAQRQLIEELIDRRLMLQAARREGVLPSPAEVQASIDELKRSNNITDDAQFRAALKAEGLTLEQVRRSITERLAIGRLLSRQVRSGILVSEEELRAYHAAHPEKYQRKPEAEIGLVFVALGPDRTDQQARARAEEALARLRDGVPFAEVARQYSDSPTRDRGGSLGVVHRGDLAPEIEQQAFGLPAGSVSAPVRTDAGWNIIKVERAQLETQVPFAEVREAVREEVFNRKYEVKREEWMAAMRARASIHVMVENPESAKP
jgi:peptidyl-prolyl cis-trans isomerase SurA